MQSGTMNGNWKEASDRRVTGVPVTRVSEEKRLQSRQRHCELENAVIVHFEDTLLVDFVVAVDIYVQISEVPKSLNYGGEGDADDRIGEVSNVQGF